MIIRGSRYEKSTTVRIKRADNTPAQAVYTERRLYVIPMDYAFHTVVSGERLDQIANAVYGNSQLWWIIARANPEVFYPDDIPPGTALRIPSGAAVR